MGNDEHLRYGRGPRHTVDLNVSPPPPTEEIKTWPDLKSAQVARHDYEPGEATDPMHTDPLCSACGQPKKHNDHR